MKSIKYVGLLVLFSVNVHASVLLDENFDDVSTMSGKGWIQVNNSLPLGSTYWFQGNSYIFPSQAGPSNSYIAANYNNADVGGNINNWLLSPNLTLNNGDQLSFYTRSAGNFADRLEVHLSSNGISQNVGDENSFGDFTRNLLTINPDLNGSDYPSKWTLETITLSGLALPVNGRIGFRYFVTNTDANGDYIGIDTLSVITPVPLPATFYFLTSGLLLLVRLSFRGSRLQSKLSL